MNDYIIVLSDGMYKIYRLRLGSDIVYQYCGASFVMLRDAEDFVEMRNNNAA